MENNHNIQDEQLNNVSGGYGTNVAPQRFNIGDFVLLRLYPEYGVGKVREARMVTIGWQYTVQFDAGMMTADEYEFIPA